MLVISICCTIPQGSLIDMESEIARLESIIQERDEQLTSFKNVLDEKETKIHKQHRMELELSEQLRSLDQLSLSKDCHIADLNSRLTDSSRDVEELNFTVSSLRTLLDEAATHGEGLEESTREKNHRLLQLEAEVKDTRLSLTVLEREVATKAEEVRSLSLMTKSQKELIKEKECEILSRLDEIEALKVSVQSLSDSLGQTVEGNKEVSSLQQEILELRVELGKEKTNVDEGRISCAALEQELVTAQGRLREIEAQQKETEDLNLSFSSYREKTAHEVRDLEQKVKGLQEHVSVEDHEHMVVEFDNVKRLFAEKEESVARLESERKELSSCCSELQLQASELSGSLDLARQELSGKESTITNLTDALELRTAAMATLNEEITQTKSEHAEKQMQCRNEDLHRKATLDEMKLELDRKETELKQVRGDMDTLSEETLAVSTELGVVKAELEVLVREKESSQFECETLRGQVESLAEVKYSLSQEQKKHKSALANLNSESARSADQMKELKSDLHTARQRLGSITAERDELIRRGEDLDADLVRNVKENEQMKQQFDSAVKLMDSKLSDQALVTSRLTGELEQKGCTIVSLKEQLNAYSSKSSELAEKLKKISADHQVSSDACGQLESDKVALQHKVGELTTNISHLQHTYSEIVSEREAIRCEYEALLNGMQEHETRVLVLTEQLAQVSREKLAMEESLREMSRHLVSSEQQKCSLSNELEQLRGTVDRAHSLDQERLVSYVCVRIQDRGVACETRYECALLCMQVPDVLDVGVVRSNYMGVINDG